MRIKLNLTKDEIEWLDRVMQFGAEVTRLMLEKQLLKGRKNWNKIQFALYLKCPFRPLKKEVS